MCVCVCVLVRYANRARNIRNSPVVNRDPNSQLVASLRRHTHTHAQDREDHEASWSWATMNHEAPRTMRLHGRPGP